MRVQNDGWSMTGWSESDMKSRRMEQAVNELYNYSVDKLHAGQLSNIPYRTITIGMNYPKWLTARLKHYVGLKKGIYVRVKAGEEASRPQHNELARTVRKLTKMLKIRTS